eukprot:Hpha_TRINITY_DN14184_c0_g1::TRINITY_DN14184_c0_g1_i1::g.10733::m.10733
MMESFNNNTITNIAAGAAAAAFVAALLCRSPSGAKDREVQQTASGMDTPPCEEHGEPVGTSSESTLPPAAESTTSPCTEVCHDSSTLTSSPPRACGGMPYIGVRVYRDGTITEVDRAVQPRKVKVTDVVVGLNGISVATDSDFLRAERGLQVGATVELTVERAGKRTQVDLQVLDGESYGYKGDTYTMDTRKERSTPPRGSQGQRRNSSGKKVK